MLKAFGANIQVTPCQEGVGITVEGPAHLTGCAVEVRAIRLQRLRHRGGADRAGLASTPAGHSCSIRAAPACWKRWREMGAHIDVQNIRRSGGEEIGDLVVHHSTLMA